MVIWNRLVMWKSSMFEYRIIWKKFISRSISTLINSPNSKKTICSGSVWSRTTKNGFSTAMWAKKRFRVSEMKHRKGNKRRASTKEDDDVNLLLLVGTSFLSTTSEEKTIVSDVYCEQLQKTSGAITQKLTELINRKGVMFHQDDVRPNTS